MKHKTFFTNALLHWHYNKNSRHIPWKGIKDPYTIWISEVIMQQTRVNFGADYFQKFITTYPTVQHLAEAEEEEVFKLWQGLGYYNRCKNLIFSARYIHEKFDGNFPDTYEEILKLKGVGSYTAAAISSFAFDLPYAVVDGNVLRILSRFYGIKTPIDSTRGKKEFSDIAQILLEKEAPAHYNQAIMDFGAVICKPANPACDICVLKTKCEAFRNNSVASFPVKQQKLTVKKRFFNFLVIKNGPSIYVEKREENDIWQNLYQFPLIESDQLLGIDEVRSHVQFQNFGQISFSHYIDHKPQKLTHQQINARFFHFQAHHQPANKKIKEVDITKLLSLPLPKIIASYLQY